MDYLTPNIFQRIMKICSNCSITEDNHWRMNNDRLLCHKCYMKLIANPKREGRRFHFRGISLLSKKKVRIGKCSSCGDRRKQVIAHY